MPAALLLSKDSHGLAFAEDPVEDEYAENEEDTDAEVETEGETEVAEEEDDTSQPTASTEAETIVLFTKPAVAPGIVPDLPAGNVAEFLVSFTNKGNKDFVLEAMDASFRYPQDFSFYIQNFTAVAFNRQVKPNHQQTVMYSFIPAEAFSQRAFGLVINLYYKDLEGSPYMDSVFNETVNVIELDTGLDGETFFLYLFLAACVVLLLVLGQQLLSSFGRKRSSKSAPVVRPTVEMGTHNPNDVDYDWLPKETLQELSRSPKRSPKTSPRQRKAKRGAGSGSDE